MTKSKKVREIYAELKSVFGDEMSSRYLLECASRIVEASVHSLHEPNLDLSVSLVPFSELPVDVVMERYGWELMNRELMFEDDFIPRAPIDVLLEQCLAQAT